MQETLRYHPIAYNLLRMAGRDDVIPLEIPITLKNGEVITEIPVKKGQGVIISVCAYNRSVEIAQIFNELCTEWFDQSAASLGRRRRNMESGKVFRCID